MLARALVLSALTILLWIAAAPLYNQALAGSLDLLLDLFEPRDMGHRVVLEGGTVKIARWIYGIEPFEYGIGARSIAYNGAILLALLLASPLSFGKRWALTLVLSMVALYLFHVLALYATAINPLPLFKSPIPAYIAPYLKRFSELELQITAALTKSLHGGGWVFAPVIIWAFAVRKKAF